MTPVRPPNRNVSRKPNAHSMGVSNETEPPHMVPIQLKNFTPVGTAISIVMRAKYGRLTAPVTYMWWAHTAMDSAAMAMVAKTRPLYPNTGLRLKAGMISEMTPKNGSART